MTRTLLLLLTSCYVCTVTTADGTTDSYTSTSDDCTSAPSGVVCECSRVEPTTYRGSPPTKT